MNKGELNTIVKKIQNECSLEEPTKITYYIDDNNQVIFKLWFDSLILPESLRTDKSDLPLGNVKNTFVNEKSYLYEDDFQILDFNEEKGWIKILTNDQDFNIVENYKQLSRSSIKETLAGKKLNRSVSNSYRLPLFEAENIKTESDETDSEKVEDEKKPTMEPKKVIFIAFTGYLLGNETLIDTLKKTLTNIIPGDGIEVDKLKLPEDLSLKLIRCWACETEFKELNEAIFSKMYSDCKVADAPNIESDKLTGEIFNNCDKENSFLICASDKTKEILEKNKPDLLKLLDNKNPLDVDSQNKLNDTLKQLRDFENLSLEKYNEMLSSNYISNILSQFEELSSNEDIWQKLSENDIEDSKERNENDSQENTEENSNENNEDSSNNTENSTDNSTENTTESSTNTEVQESRNLRYFMSLVNRKYLKEITIKLQEDNVKDLVRKLKDSYKIANEKYSNALRDQVIDSMKGVRKSIKRYILNNGGSINKYIDRKNLEEEQKEDVERWEKIKNIALAGNTSFATFYDNCKNTKISSALADEWLSMGLEKEDFSKTDASFSISTKKDKVKKTDKVEKEISHSENYLWIYLYMTENNNVDKYNPENNVNNIIKEYWDTLGDN